MQVRSSSLDRTIMTARAFLDGAFPPLNAPTPDRYLPDGQQVAGCGRLGAAGRHSCACVCPRGAE